MFLKYVIHLFQDDYTRNKKKSTNFKTFGFMPIDSFASLQIKVEKMLLFDE